MHHRPIPAVTQDNKEFWEGCGRNTLLLQKCRSCSATQYYPRAVCTACGATDIEWVQSPGKGTVYSYTVVHRAAAETLKEATPYLIALVQLREGPRIMSNIVDCAPEAARIGMEVEVDFDHDTEGLAVPVFRPAG